LEGACNSITATPVVITVVVNLGCSENKKAAAGSDF